MEVHTWLNLSRLLIVGKCLDRIRFARFGLVPACKNHLRYRATLHSENIATANGNSRNKRYPLASQDGGEYEQRFWRYSSRTTNKRNTPCCVPAPLVASNSFHILRRLSQEPNKFALYMRRHCNKM